jgi:hypothetical protein
MDIKRGTGPDKIVRPLSVEFTRQEVLEMLTAYVKRKLGTEVNLDSLKGMGTDNVLESIVFSGTETLPIVWQGSPPMPIVQAEQS